MELRIVLDTERGEYDVWANTRVAKKGIEVISDDEPREIGFSCEKGFVWYTFCAGGFVPAMMGFACALPCFAFP